MNILITGSAGFIGSHLAEAFTEAQHTVFGVDTFETGRPDNWLSVELDICDRQQFYAYANKSEPQLVVHCAASYKDPNHWHRDTQVNVEGAINVAAVAHHHNTPIIYFQTVLPPISSYAISKIAGEHYLRISNQPLTVYRLASVYGPRNLSGPIPTFYKRIKAGDTCTVVMGVTRDFVYIGDLVKRVMDDHRQEASGSFDIGTGIETSIATLPDMIGEALGVEPIVRPRRRAADDVARYDMDPDKLEDPIRIEDGIMNAVRWYEQNGVGDTYTHLALKD